MLAGGYRRWRPRAAHATLPASSGEDHPPSSSMDRGYLNPQSPPTAGAALACGNGKLGTGGRGSAQRWAPTCWQRRVVGTPFAHAGARVRLLGR